MILRAGYLSCPITRPGSIYSFLKKTPPLFSLYKPKLSPPFLIPQNPIDQIQLPINKSQKFCTITSFSPKPTFPIPPISNKSAKKAMRELPERVLQHKLGGCSKNKDLVEALRLYDEARVSNVKLDVHHYNVLLYLCSLGLEGVGDLGLVRGFEIYKQMCVDRVVLNEASFTSVARLAVGKEDFEMAFDLVKEMKRCGVVPKLRSYEPALFGFCGMGMAERAYAVDRHMAENGVVGEEEEVCALLKVSSGVGREEKVYEMLHRLRGTVRQVSEESVEVVEEWFGSERAAEVGVEEWDAGMVKDGVVKGGGGWHGQGWLGKGKWKVARTKMEESGVCRSCGERLVPIDIDPRETENFASSLSALACERETRADFVHFQEWLQRHGPFDAVVDGANMGLINQHNFNFSQLNSFVNRLRDMSPSKKLPLVVLHRSRVTSGPAQNPKNKKLLEKWENAGALYATPHGSNDDWYWLYAAVSCKCLLLTNDEMRDHLFQLLGTNFFPRWKEKHQVRVNVSRQGAKFHMPPPYSIVIQESEQGSWHVPTVTGDDLESPREWLCATRTRIQP